VKILKTDGPGALSEVQMHEAVARSTFPRQNAQKLMDREDFLKFRC